MHACTAHESGVMIGGSTRACARRSVRSCLCTWAERDFPTLSTLDPQHAWATYAARQCTEMDQILDDLTIENEIGRLLDELDELEESFPLVHAKYTRIKGGWFGEMTTVASDEGSNGDAAVHVLPEYKFLDWSWVQERGDLEITDPTFACNYVALDLWLRCKKALNSDIATLQVSRQTPIPEKQPRVLISPEPQTSKALGARAALLRFRVSGPSLAL